MQRRTPSLATTLALACLTLTSSCAPPAAERPASTSAPRAEPPPAAADVDLEVVQAFAWRDDLTDAHWELALAALAHEDPETRLAGCTGLGHSLIYAVSYEGRVGTDEPFGRGPLWTESRISSLLDQVVDPDPRVRRCVFGILGKTGASGGRLIGTLARQAVADSESGDHAAGAMVQIARAAPEFVPEVQEELLAIIHEGDPEPRRMATYSLAALDPFHPEALEPLMTLAREVEYDTWTRAIRDIPRAGPAAVPVLGELLSDENRQKRSAVLEALVGVDSDLSSIAPDIVKELNAPNGAYGMAAELLAHRPRLAAWSVPELAKLSRHADPDHYGAALNSLRRLGPAAAPALPTLRELAESDDEARANLAKLMIPYIDGSGAP